MGLGIIKNDENNGGNSKDRRRGKFSLKSGISTSKSGRWTDLERRTFLKGLKKFGRGKWKEIATLIPTRSTVQVKTHAQMIMKRVEAGDDVFAEFDDSWPSHCQQFDVHRAFSDNSDEDWAGPHSAPCLLEVYSNLSQMDQRAVHILYRMAQLSALCMQKKNSHISFRAP